MQEEKELEETPEDLLTFDIQDIYVPTNDVLQQIDAGELLTADDLELYMDEVIVQDIEGLF